MIKAECCRVCKRVRFQKTAYSWSEFARIDFSKLTHPVQTAEVTCTQCLLQQQHEIAVNAGSVT